MKWLERTSSFDFPCGHIALMDPVSATAVHTKPGAGYCEEKQRLAEYQSKFGRDVAPDLGGKRVVLIDDGLATGATAEAAVLSAKKRGSTKVMVAIPVASESSIRRLAVVADEVIALLIDPAFDAVGRYYEHFSQTSDEEVMELLKNRSEDAG